MIDDRRVGKFRIKLEMINKNPNAVKNFMGNMIVLEAKIDFMRHSVEYTAINETLFDEVPFAESAPYYTLNYFHHEGETAIQGVQKENEYPY